MGSVTDYGDKSAVPACMQRWPARGFMIGSRHALTQAQAPLNGGEKWGGFALREAASAMRGGGAR